MGITEKADAAIINFLDSEQGKKINGIVKYIVAGEILGIAANYNQAAMVIAFLPVIWVLIVLAKNYYVKKEKQKEEAKPNTSLG